MGWGRAQGKKQRTRRETGKVSNAKFINSDVGGSVVPSGITWISSLHFPLGAYGFVAFSSNSLLSSLLSGHFCFYLPLSFVFSPIISIIWNTYFFYLDFISPYCKKKRNALYFPLIKRKKKHLKLHKVPNEFSPINSQSQIGKKESLLSPRLVKEWYYQDKEGIGEGRSRLEGG